MRLPRLLMVFGERDGYRLLFPTLFRDALPGLVRDEVTQVSPSAAPRVGGRDTGRIREGERTRRGGSDRSEKVVVIGWSALGLAPDGVGVEYKRVDEGLGIDDGARGWVLGVVELWLGSAIQGVQDGMCGLERTACGEGRNQGDGDGGELGSGGDVVAIGDGDAHHDTSASAAWTRSAVATLFFETAAAMSA
jgi:hypothetical protein